MELFHRVAMVNSGKTKKPGPTGKKCNLRLREKLGQNDLSNSLREIEYSLLRMEHKAEHNNCRMRGSEPKLKPSNPSVTV